MLWIFSFLVALIGCVWGTFCRDEKRPIFGIYRTKGPNWPVKFSVMFVFLSLRKIWNFIQLQDVNDSVPAETETTGCYMEAQAGYGTRSRPHPHFMDRAQPLSSHPQAIDAVYFNGASKDGWSIIAATARRPKSIVNGFLFLRIPGVGLLTAPRHPDTTMIQCPPSDQFCAEGLSLTPVVPMVAWTVQYDGLLRVESTYDGSPLKIGSLVKGQLKGLWTSTLPYFDYDVDMSPFAVATAMAKQPWSRRYFEVLKKNHQTHYEQFGELRGSIAINDDSYQFNLSTVRDHSYGEKREWKDFHRYALHYFTAENGMKLAMGVVCMPNMFSRLVIGYIYTPEGDLHAIQSTTFTLNEHGEGGTPPTDYAFSVTAGGDEYDVLVKVEERSHVYLPDTWDAKVIECFATARINSHAAWGAVEFEYRHLEQKLVTK